MKTESEREITEKHRAVLQMYDKESKINKRLSMDKEQLLWQLGHESVALPSTQYVVRRATDQPFPVRSAPSTPSLNRQGAAAVHSTPKYRLLSLAEFDKLTPEDFDDANDDF